MKKQILIFPNLEYLNSESQLRAMIAAHNSVWPAEKANCWAGLFVAFANFAYPDERWKSEKSFSRFDRAAGRDAEVLWYNFL